MGNVYIYEADADDFSTIGICGALTPTSCSFHAIANGKDSITLEHPMDELNRYTCLQENRILKVDVPVRTTPEISNGQFVTVVEKWHIKSTALKANRYIYNKADPDAKKNKKLKLANAGDEIIVLAKYEDDDWRWKVTYSWQERKRKRKKVWYVTKSVTGYIAHDDTTLEMEESIEIPDTSTGIETVSPSWRIKEQLFRIVSVEKTETSVKVEADHISYDLMYNLTGYEYDENRTLQQAADGMLDGCFEDHQFTFQTNIQGEKSGFHFRDKDPITALLDPDIGLITRWSGELIRDNYSLTVLDHAGTNRGTMFTYGKNISGVSMSIDYTNVATAIRPVGEDADGNPLYLDKSYLWDGTTTTALSDTNGIVYGRWHYLDTDGSIACKLPHARIYPLDGDECKVDKKKGPSVDDVRTRLLEQAIAELNGGGEDPETSVSVDMRLLGFTSQWSMYQDLEKVFLFDTVRVRHPAMGIDLETAISEIEWDCLNDEPTGITTGDINDLTSSVASWQISSVSGAKITSGTVSGGKIAEGAISTGHIQSDSITTDLLAANSVTANKIAAGSVTAEAIQTGSLDAITVNAIKAYLQTLTSETIYTDELVAQMLRVNGYAKIDNLIADTADVDALIVRDELSQRSYIKTLQVLSAQLVYATVGELVVKCSDGLYYRLDVDKNGAVTATNVTVTEGEIAKGVTSDGRSAIIETDLTAENLSTEYFKATNALVETLKATQIDCTALMAREAFIDNLKAVVISPKGKTLKIMAEDAEYMEVTKNGTYMKSKDSDNAMLLNSTGVSILIGAKTYSQFAANYVQFGNYQLRQSSDGGLVFKKKEV